MPIMKESPRTGTKCYIHEMQRPLMLPFQHKVYHVCPTCQARLLELAKAEVHLKLSEEVIALSVETEAQEEQVRHKKAQKIKKAKSTLQKRV